MKTSNNEQTSVDCIKNKKVESDVCVCYQKDKANLVKKILEGGFYRLMNFSRFLNQEQMLIGFLGNGFSNGYRTNISLFPMKTE